MTKKEAIEYLKETLSAYKERCNSEWCNKDREAIKELEDAAELHTPKEPTIEGDGYAPDGSFVWDEWICPNCGSRYEIDYDEYDFCPCCGQRIDRSGIESLLT